VHYTNLACDWKCQDESSAHVIGFPPQVHDHINSIEDVQVAPSQVLYSPSLYTQHQPRGIVREVHIIMLPGNWDAKRRNSNYPGRRNRIVCACVCMCII